MLFGKYLVSIKLLNLFSTHFSTVLLDVSSLIIYKLLFAYILESIFFSPNFS